MGAFCKSSFLTICLITGVLFFNVFGSVKVYAQADASSFSQDQKLQLDQTISNFVSAMDDKNYDEVVNISIPPNVMEYLAGMSGLELSVFKPQVGKMMGNAMESIDIYDYAFETDKTKYYTLPDGSQYALIPTIVTMSAMGQTMRTYEETFAMYDDNRWYLVRVSDANQVRIMRIVYSQYSDVKFKPSKIEHVQ